MPVHTHPQDDASDAALLEALIGPDPKVAKVTFARRDNALDPLLIAAAAASGPHVTRNHYHHDFFPGVMLPKVEGAWDWTKFAGEDSSAKAARKRLVYVSLQAPRTQRLAAQDAGKLQTPARETAPLQTINNLPPTPKKRPTLSAHSTSVPKTPSVTSNVAPTPSLTPAKPPVEVKCMARTRIPTPHGPAFLHLYHNNRDSKEHLAIVVDPAQSSDPPLIVPAIRSQSLDAVWGENETQDDRIIRGAYVGRLSTTSKTPSTPTPQAPVENPWASSVPAPLIRIHSECFTGETIGSMRCDCGEQLDEAIRQISLPITLPPTGSNGPKVIPDRKSVV